MLRLRRQSSPRALFSTGADSCNKDTRRLPLLTATTTAGTPSSTEGRPWRPASRGGWHRAGSRQGRGCRRTSPRAGRSCLQHLQVELRVTDVGELVRGADHHVEAVELVIMSSVRKVTPLLIQAQLLPLVGRVAGQAEPRRLPASEEARLRKRSQRLKALLLGTGHRDLDQLVRQVLACDR